MAIIAVANQKGGVGKTTSTLNLGAALQERGKGVLLIDLDPQGNLGTAAGIADIDNAYPSIGDLLSLAARGRSRGGLTLDDAIVPTPSGLDVVPSNATLSASELALVSAMNRESALAGLLERAATQYDHILIDCLPSLGLLAINALRAADTVLVPVQADFLAMQGMAQIFETIAAVREQLNPQLGILGVLLTLVDQRTAHSREVVEAVRSSLEGQVTVFETEVRLHAALKDAAKLGRSILETEPDSSSAAAYRALAHEVLVALGEEEPTPVQVVEVAEEPVEAEVAAPEPRGIALLAPSFETFVHEGWSQWLGNAGASATSTVAELRRQGPNRLAQARTAVLEHRFEDAARQSAHILSDAPGCLEALRILAWAQLELAEARALMTFQRCAELDPEDARAEVGQAIWHQLREHEAEAVAHWVRAWELDPHNQPIRRALVRLTGDLPESLLAEGIGLLRVGRCDEAADVLRQVLAANPSDAAANLGLITASRALGSPREAGVLLAGLHGLAPSSVKGLLYLAAAQEAEGHTLRARELLARAEQADPGLVLFGDVARELFATPASPETRASRPTLASAW